MYWCECMLETGLGWHLSSPSALVSEKALSLRLELTDSARLAGHQTQGVSYLHLPSTDTTGMHLPNPDWQCAGVQTQVFLLWQPSSDNLATPQPTCALRTSFHHRTYKFSYEKAGQSKQKFRIQGLTTKKLWQAMVHSVLQITWNNYVLTIAMTWRKLNIRKGSYLNSL